MITSYTVLEDDKVIQDIALGVEQVVTHPPIEGIDQEQKVNIVSNTENYLNLMKELFDFEAIKEFFANRQDFKMTFDGMHGVGGPYG